MKVSIVIISKDEQKLDDTLAALNDHLAAPEVAAAGHEVEVVVIDASDGRLDYVRDNHPRVRWVPFSAPPGIRISIPHQRNAGIRAASGDVIIFTDAGCIPQEGWLVRLLAPITSGEERVTAGPSWTGDNVYSPERGASVPTYLTEAATINLAFTRAVADLVGEFDEQFEYGSDVDYTRRMVRAEIPIRFLPEAGVEHDWGDFRRQLKRSVKYGSAAVRLHRKHDAHSWDIFRTQPVPVLYALYLLGLPLAVRYRSYLLVLLVPLWRARKRPYPVRVVVEHLAQGYGGLRELARVQPGRLEVPHPFRRGTQCVARGRQTAAPS